MTTLLTISGSLRRASLNRKLLAEAVRVYGPADVVDADLRLPLYDGDLEVEGLPGGVQTLSDQIAAADGVVISTPEYNKALSGVLKNALDWVSRTEGAPWRDKPVAILSATAGRAGGEQTQVTLRHCLTPFRPRVVNGPDVYLGGAVREFDDAGRLTNARTLKSLTGLMEALREEISRNA